MLKTIEGVYKNGVVTLSESPEVNGSQVRVLVTFLTDAETVDLSKTADAADMRARLESFVEDWDDPSMDAYNNYDETLNELRKGSDSAG